VFVGFIVGSNEEGQKSHVNGHPSLTFKVLQYISSLPVSLIHTQSRSLPLFDVNVYEGLSLQHIPHVGSEEVGGSVGSSVLEVEGVGG